MDDAYQEGYDAFQKGCATDANPYGQDAEKEKAWEEGWEDAKIDAELKRREICSSEIV